jgi:hypothetical protein
VSRLETHDARALVRQRIVSQLRSDEWMGRHFGIFAHADDVADAVMSLFSQVIDSPWFPGSVLMRWAEPLPVPWPSPSGPSTT